MQPDVYDETQPKIAVQALNPHGGENGLFGDEEATIIKPAMKKAKAMGMDKDLGSLECGKKEDVIILNMWQPHLVPNFMPVHRLVYEAVGNDVETVIVDGRIVMKDRKPLYVDENEVLESGQEEALRTVKRAGIEQHMIPPKTFWGAHGWLDEKRVDYSSLISRP